jgi:hypothetical protein
MTCFREHEPIPIFRVGWNNCMLPARQFEVLESPQKRICMLRTYLIIILRSRQGRCKAEIDTEVERERWSRITAKYKKKFMKQNVRQTKGEWGNLLAKCNTVRRDPCRPISPRVAMPWRQLRLGSAPGAIGEDSEFAASEPFR